MNAAELEPPIRIETTLAPPIGMAALGAALVLAVIAGALHPAIRALVVFAVAFPALWIVVVTALTHSTARALRSAGAKLPSHMHAMESFRLTYTLANVGQAFPAVGVLTNPRFSSGEVKLDSAPWAALPVLEAGRAGTSSWDVTANRRGVMLVGPFRASVELPGSAIRSTAVFQEVYTVNVLPAEYHLAPFVDTLLAGRHVAVGRYLKLPAATDEYVGAREYRPGDAPKLIHRVLSLRALDPDQFYEREFQDPSREDLSLVLDTSPPIDGDDLLHRYRLEKAICFVAALCRMFAARRLTVRFVYQRAPHEVVMLRVRPLDSDLNRLERELMRADLRGNRVTLGRVVRDEVRRYGAAVIFVSLRPRELVEQQRLAMVTLTPDHLPVFTREVVHE